MPMVRGLDDRLAVTNARVTAGRYGRVAHSKHRSGPGTSLLAVRLEQDRTSWGTLLTSWASGDKHGHRDLTTE
ncbi:MAG: hypothetical protein IH861_15910 [Chloroflexi bacterium]|nr:hypothetical protein [Chloroflexota bacterium]